MYSEILKTLKYTISLDIQVLSVNTPRSYPCMIQTCLKRNCNNMFFHLHRCVSGYPVCSRPSTFYVQNEGWLDRCGVSVVVVSRDLPFKKKKRGLIHCYPLNLYLSIVSIVFEAEVRKEGEDAAPRVLELLPGVGVKCENLSDLLWKVL